MLSTTNNNLLNSLERTTLRNCEKVVDKGCETFVEVGAALLEINSQRLYRETHKSFDVYCKDKWGFTGARARQFIGGAEVAKQVESATRVAISNEAQTRPLTQLPEDKRGLAWKGAVEIAEGGSPTMAQVQEAVDVYKGADNEPIDVDSKPAGGISDRVAVQLDGNPIENNKVQLGELAKLPEEDQLEVVAHIGEGKSKTVPAAVAKLKIKPDYGKCPNCAGTKWKETDDGVSCAKCNQPHGEPAGDADEDRVKTQRQKTCKTGEALMRAFDDLQTMLAKPEHAEAIESCKKLIETAKGWK